MNLSPTLARLIHAVLYAIIVFVVLFIIGLIVSHFDASIGSVIEKFAGLIAILAGVYLFLVGHKPVG